MNKIGRFSLALLFLLFSSMSLAIDTTKLTAQLQKILNSAIIKYSTPGAVLLISSPDLGTISVAAGYANTKTKIPMDINNNFRIASMSKTFLAVCILKLTDKGLLNLDDKISKYLPPTVDMTRIPNGNKATIRQLLEMRSGIPNYMDYDGYSDLVKNDPQRHWVPEDAIKIIYDTDPTAKPGTTYEYSNTNYILLQLILETITHDTLAAELRRNIFNPLHMKNTYQEIQEERSGGFKGLQTHGYDLENGHLLDVTTLNDGFGLGDGGIISTAEDMKLFVQGLLEKHLLLSDNLLHEMQHVIGEDEYGLGIYKDEVNDESAWSHDGTASGFSGQFYYFPDKKLTMIILTNFASSNLFSRVASKTLALIVRWTKIAEQMGAHYIMHTPFNFY